MRTLLAILGLAVLILVGLLWAGLINLDTRPGSLPTVEVRGGEAPSVKADVARVTVGQESKTVTVPTIDVEKPANGQ